MGPIQILMSQNNSSTSVKEIAGSFRHYYLFERRSRDVGLTDIPWNKLTQIIGPGVFDGFATVDLGFGFWFNGNLYDKIQVSTSGWMILGDSPVSDFMTDTVLSLSIKTSISSSSTGTLLCPFYFRIQTLPGNNPTYGQLGGLYYTKDESSKEGVRGIIRWICTTERAVVPTDAVLVFECVLYEQSGKIEFRYSPIVAAPGNTVTNISEDHSGNGGVIGVWTGGTNSWRDFSRVNFIRGGAVFDPSYTYTEAVLAGPPITPLPWFWGNRIHTVTELGSTLYETWPGGRVVGSMFKFIPGSSSVRTLPPDDIRSRDSKDVYFQDNSEYNDTRTVIFGASNKNVTYPTTRPILFGDKTDYDSESYMDSITSLTVTDAVMSSAASERWIDVQTYDRNDDVVPPFDESSMIEQGVGIKSTSFYTTGTDSSSGLIGFEQNIGAKRIVRIKLPILSSSQLNPTTASMYYYDVEQKAVLRYGTSPLRDPGDVYSPGAMVDAIGFSPLGTVDSNVIDESYDHIFKPLIDLNASDVQNTDAKHQGCASGFGAQLSQNFKSNSLMGRNGGLFTVSSSFDLSSTSMIDMSNYIDEPMLIEKVIMRVPIKCGPGWSHDMTRTKRTIGFNDFSSSIGTTPEGSLIMSHLDWPLDIGGPCVTLGLMNQISPGVRDLIVTGTFIPKDDDVSNINFELAHHYGAFDEATSTPVFIDFNNFSLTLEGFKAYSRNASATVDTGIDGFFTGSVVVPAEVVTSTGFIVQPIHRTNFLDDVDAMNQWAKTTGLTGLGNVPLKNIESFYGLLTAALIPNNFFSYVYYDKNLTLLPQPSLVTGRYGSEYINLSASDVVVSGQLASSGEMIVSVNPCGRSNEGFKSTGRSTRDQVGLSNLTVKNPLYDHMSEIETWMHNKLMGTGNCVLDGAFTYPQFEVIPDVVYTVESTEKAPYIIKPRDHVVFFMSKHRPVKSGSLSSLIADIDPGAVRPIIPGDISSGLGGLYSVLTGSHDIQIDRGEIEIILIGSYVGRRFNSSGSYSVESTELDTAMFDKKLFQSSIHDTIGDTPVTDQFDSDYSSVYRGTYLDNVITGSLFSIDVELSPTFNKTSLSIGNRGRAALATDGTDSTMQEMNSDVNDMVTVLTPTKDVRGSMRFLQVHDSVERFWDTILPDLSDIWSADGVNVYYGVAGYPPSQGNTYDTAVFYAGQQVLPADHEYYTDENIHLETSSSLRFTNMAWLSAFPFEPRYSSCRRIPSFLDKFTTNTEVTWFGGQDPDNSNIYSPFSQREMNKNIDKAIISVNVGTDIFWSPLRCGLNFKNYDTFFDYNTFFGTQVGEPFYDRIEFAKSVFGFSSPEPDTQEWFRQGTPFDPLLSGSFPSPSRSLHMRTRRSPITLGSTPSFLHSAGMVIDGWKYGIMNGVRQTSKHIFRRDHFGQFRDMLEQRLDSKFFIESLDDRAGSEQSFTTGVNSIHTLNRGKSTYLNTLTDSPVTVTFIGPDGKTTDPYRTDSSNMSNEATSSLPFIDEEAHNIVTKWTIPRTILVNRSFGTDQLVNRVAVNKNNTVVNLSFDRRGNTTIR